LEKKPAREKEINFSKRSKRNGPPKEAMNSTGKKWGQYFMYKGKKNLPQ